MRDLAEIQQANKEFEEREAAGDFSEDEDCEDCGCPIEDCVCLSYDYESDGLEGVDLDG
jgi:hypothetical protein